MRGDGELLGSREDLHRYALWLVRRSRDLVAADEAKAVADLAMVKAWHRFRAARNPSFYAYARHWVRGAIMNHVTEVVTRKETEEVRCGLQDRPASGNLEEEVWRRVRLEGLLKALTPESRAVLLAHAVGGVSLAALAREQGRHRAWACRRYQRALVHLRAGGARSGWVGVDKAAREPSG